jgi:hypothetical protein
MVQAAWNDPTSNTKPFHRLRHKLYATTKTLRSWRSSIISNARLKLLMAQQVILQFDIAQESRELTKSELRIRTKLKKRVPGWVVIERAHKQQCARATNLNEGDANTRYFHLRANDRRRKNFIHAYASAMAG